MSNVKDYNTILVEFYKKKILEIGDFNLKSGINSPYYFDFRKIYAYPEICETLCKFIYRKYEGHLEKADRIAGVPLGAIPLATHISKLAKKPLIIPRNNIKTYGNKKEIEGIMEVGDEVILFEDTITTGKSLLATIKLIEKNGGQVELIIIVFNREEGGVEMLEALGYKVKILYNVVDVIDKLFEDRIIDDYLNEKITNYVALKKNELIKTISKMEKREDEGPQEDTDPIFNHPLRVATLKLAIDKQTIICLSLDCTTWAECKDIIRKCGKYILMVRTRVELYSDIDDIADFAKEIMQLADEYKFLIFEDAKYGDGTNICWLKMTKGKFRPNDWATFVSIHGLTSASVLQYYKDKYNESQTYKPRLNFCLVMQTNNLNSLSNSEYTAKCMEIARSYNEYVPFVMCNACMNLGGVIKITDGVYDVIDNINLDLEGGCKYKSIEQAIIDENNHIVIVADGILNAPDVEEAAAKYARISWEHFSSLHCILIEQTNKYITKIIENKKILEQKHKEYMEFIAKEKENAHDDGDTSTADIVKDSITM